MKIILLINGLLVLLVGAGILHYEYPNNPISQIYITNFVSLTPDRTEYTTEKKQAEERPIYKIKNNKTGEIYAIEGPVGSTQQQAYEIFGDLSPEQKEQFLVYRSTNFLNKDFIKGIYIILAIFIAVETLTLLIGYSVKGNVVAQRLTIVLSGLWVIGTLAIKDPFHGGLGRHGMGGFSLDLPDLLLITILPVVVVWGIIWILSGFRVKPSS